MADGIESFSAEKNRARVAAGFKGGNFFVNPVEVPARTIVDGYTESVDAKLMSTPIKQGTPMDTWFTKRN